MSKRTNQIIVSPEGRVLKKLREKHDPSMKQTGKAPGVSDSHISQIENDFEGTLVLEKLAEVGKVDAFFEAIDSDDFAKARALMRRADIDVETVALVLKKLREHIY